MSPSKNRHALHILFAVGFFFTAHIAVLEYINSSYLEQFVSINSIGFIYAISSILSAIIITTLSSLLLQMGNFRLTLTYLGISIISLIGLAFVRDPIAAVVLFIIHYSLNIVIRTNFDIYFEEITDQKNAGTARGKYLTSVSAAWALSPLLLIIALPDNNYTYVYLLSTVFGITSAILIALNLRSIKDIHFRETGFSETLRCVIKKADLRNIVMIRTLFNFFIAWLVIYGPIYLHHYVGFSWQELGILFAIMLLPYALFQAPLGKLADSKYGEKEILIIGFVIMVVSGTVMTLTSSTNFWVWAAIMFLTRTGASLVQVMSDTYFFKKADKANPNNLEIFRDARPLAYVIAPLLGGILLFFVDIKYLFVILASIMTLGISFSLGLKDTK